ncbi:hypothetical protein Hypma_000249 [Hypsizygus marmoreus]|uniref:Uncharacterized protein n=1 Tax=Hypsizygus marmoreus TaxID=39966 RepID=A0A369JDN3_HYPMA|nr:hypothetical protein Hypma_000249 [Hypsizygus marmoreus]
MQRSPPPRFDAHGTEEPRARRQQPRTTPTSFPAPSTLSGAVVSGAAGEETIDRDEEGLRRTVPHWKRRTRGAQTEDERTTPRCAQQDTQRADRWRRIARLRHVAFCDFPMTERPSDHPPAVLNSDLPGRTASLTRSDTRKRRYHGARGRVPLAAMPPAGQSRGGRGRMTYLGVRHSIKACEDAPYDTLSVSGIAGSSEEIGGKAARPSFVRHAPVTSLFDTTTIYERIYGTPPVRTITARNQIQLNTATRTQPTHPLRRLRPSAHTNSIPRCPASSGKDGDDGLWVRKGIQKPRSTPSRTTLRQCRAREMVNNYHSTSRGRTPTSDRRRERLLSTDVGRTQHSCTTKTHTQLQRNDQQAAGYARDGTRTPPTDGGTHDAVEMRRGECEWEESTRQRRGEKRRPEERNAEMITARLHPYLPHTKTSPRPAKTSEIRDRRNIEKTSGVQGSGEWVLA